MIGFIVKYSLNLQLLTAATFKKETNNSNCRQHTLHYHINIPRGNQSKTVRITICTLNNNIKIAQIKNLNVLNTMY